MGVFFEKVKLKFKEVAELIILAHIVVTAATIILQFVVELDPQSNLNKFIVNNYMKIIMSQSFLLLFISIILLYTAVAYRRRRKNALEAREQLELARVCEVPFQVISKVNAAADSNLFCLLFRDIILVVDNSKMNIVNGSILSAAGVVRRNIEDLIDIIKKVFDDFTKCPCAVSVYILDAAVSSDNILESDLTVLSRDDVSELSRGTIRKLKASDSTEFSKILRSQGREYFVSNDLNENMSYISGMPDWKKFYSSILAISIPDLDPDAKFPVRGILTVDNKNGKLDHDLLLHYLREMSWRFGVMAYRLQEIGLVLPKTRS